MTRISFPRQVGRLCSFFIGAHVLMTGSITLFSRLSTDRLFEEHWRYSIPVLRRRVTYAFWDRSFYIPSLTTQERECFDAMMKLIALDAPDHADEAWSTRVILQDSIALLDGVSEMRDAVYALSKCLHKVTPVVHDIRRERQGPTTFLNCRLSLEVEGRIPLVNYAVRLFSMPVAVSLQLERPEYAPHRLHIAAVEHRWWGGRIWSTQTGSMGSPWGDIGDLVRRYNGFMMSTMITKEAKLKKKVTKVREAAQRVDMRVKEEQERQVAAVAEDYNDGEVVSRED